jgi:hypothetical protein
MGSVKQGEYSCHVMSAFVYGLDIHKDNTYAAILNSEGKITNQTIMGNERAVSYNSHFNVDGWHEVFQSDHAAIQAAHWYDIPCCGFASQEDML